MTDRIDIYVGTYTQPLFEDGKETRAGAGEGVYRCSFEPGTGRLQLASVTGGIVNPSYLALSVDGRFLYCVNEIAAYEGAEAGSASAFALRDGEPVPLNIRSSLGSDPCYIGASDSGTHAAVANYSGGNICVYPVSPDGSLGEPSRLSQHTGKSVHPERQAQPHPHSAVFAPDKRYLLVCDLGLDLIVIYRTDFEGNGIADAPSAQFSAAPGAGPRHCVFSASGKRCYVVNKLDVSVSVLEYDGDGGLTQLQTVPLAPGEMTAGGGAGGEITGGDLLLSPDGRYAYASVRGLDRIVVLQADAATGKLTHCGSVPSGGRTPRNLTLTPKWPGGAGERGDDFLLVANQDSDVVAVFRLDSASGLPEQVFELNIPTPVCVKAQIRAR